MVIFEYGNVVPGQEENGDCLASKPPHKFDPEDKIGIINKPLNLEIPDVIKLFTVVFALTFGIRYCTTSLYKIFLSGLDIYKDSV